MSIYLTLRPNLLRHGDIAAGISYASFMSEVHVKYRKRGISAKNKGKK